MKDTYKPFPVMKQTDALARIQSGRAVYGPVGEPYEDSTEERQVAWLDLTDAAPAGKLEKSDRLFIACMARLLDQVRQGKGGKGTEKLLANGLRKMGLTPGEEPTPAELLNKFKGKGRPVN